MQNGDLSNVVVPRLVLVFEGALGFLPPDRVEDYNKLGSRGEWGLAVACWDLNEMMCRKIWDVCYRQSFQLEVVTYAGPAQLAQSLQERLDDEGLPVSRVLASTPQRMARRLAYAPDIAYVYDVNPQHVMMYGGKGRHLTSVHQLGR